jgi:hypothetical protein
VHALLISGRRSPGKIENFKVSNMPVINMVTRKKGVAMMAHSSPVPEMVVREDEEEIVEDQPAEEDVPNPGAEGTPEWRARLDVQLGRLGVVLDAEDRFLQTIARARTGTLLFMLLGIYATVAILAGIAIAELDDLGYKCFYGVLVALLLFDINQIIYIATVDTRDHLNDQNDQAEEENHWWRMFSRNTSLWRVAKISLGVAILIVNGLNKPTVFPLLALYHVLTAGLNYIFACAVRVRYAVVESRMPADQQV